jgi:hypothetical protein
MNAVEQLRWKFRALAPVMDERMTRLWAAAEARALGRGGIARVTEATGILDKRIRAGLRDLEELEANPPTAKPQEQRIRRPGAGRPAVEERDEQVVARLDALIDPITRGDPQSPLRWTIKSTRRLAEELSQQGHPIGASSVRRLLVSLGYSLQGNRKTREGTEHPDRNDQFEYINRQVRDFQSREQPVISVDTKKKELLGDFKNGGREWLPAGEPERVRVHDFIDRDLGKAIPYGVYDVFRNEGWVSVGIDHDTAEFAVASIRRWWQRMGVEAYAEARELLITADAGGSNGPKVRLWKVELQKLADETGLRIHVCHYPPGTSKWNKIEHRMFCHITQNWRGRPLESLETVVNLIGSTSTAAGLRIKAAADKRRYPEGRKVSDDVVAAVRVVGARKRPEWNYAINPRALAGEADR